MVQCSAIAIRILAIRSHADTILTVWFFRDYHPRSRPEEPEQHVHLKDLDHYFYDDNNGRSP
jgi:hypothetical protein